MIMLGGCAVTTDFNLRDKEQIYKSIEVKNDKFRNQISYTAPPIKAGNIFNNKTWLLRAFKTGNSLPTTQIYVSIYYTSNNWKYFSDAASNGKVLPSKIISRNVVSCDSTMGCSYREDLVINVDIDKLKTLLDKNGVLFIGIKDRFGENWVIDITSEYLDAFERKLIEKG